MNIIVLKQVGQNAPVATRAQVEADIETIDERFAQAGVRVKRDAQLGWPKINMGSDGNGEPLPQVAGLTWDLGFEFDGPLGEETYKLRDGDRDSLDIFYVPSFSGRTKIFAGPRGFSLGRDFAAQPGRGEVYRNVVVVSPERFTYTTAHEVGHIIMDLRSHPPVATSLMSPEGNSKAVDGKKRISAYPPSGNADDKPEDRAMSENNRARKYAETLP